MKYIKKYENIDWDWVEEEENDYNYKELIDVVKHIINEDIVDDFYDAIDNFLENVKFHIKKDFISKFYNFIFIIDEYNIEWMTNKIIDAFQWIFENNEKINLLDDFLLKCIKNDINNVISFLPEEISKKFKN
jgi:uncharacterized protein YjgD (DUF1641 family)